MKQEKKANQPFPFQASFCNSRTRLLLELLALLGLFQEGMQSHREKATTEFYNPATSFFLPLFPSSNFVFPQSFALVFLLLQFLNSFQVRTDFFYFLREPCSASLRSGQQAFLFFSRVPARSRISRNPTRSAFRFLSFNHLSQANVRAVVFHLPRVAPCPTYATSQNSQDHFRLLPNSTGSSFPSESKASGVIIMYFQIPPSISSRPFP